MSDEVEGDELPQALYIRVAQLPVETIIAVLQVIHELGGSVPDGAPEAFAFALCVRRRARRRTIIEAQRAAPREITTYGRAR